MIACTYLAFVLAVWTEKKWALPLLTACASYFPFLIEVRVSVLRGFWLVLTWSVLLSSLVLFFSFRNPERMRKAIWRGDSYTEAMFGWIKTGKLPEGNTVSILLFHLRQTILYCVLAFASANFLSLLLGAALLNYMNFYVSQLALRSKRRVRAFVIGWNPWSVIRVVAFLWLGIVFSLPLLSPRDFTFGAMLPGIIGVILDVTLKILLSAYWRKLLKENMVS